MPFGMKNAPATFQRMVNKLVRDIDGCECNPLVLFFICHLVSSIFKVMLAESSLFNLKAIQVLDCILPLKFF